MNGSHDETTLPPPNPADRHSVGRDDPEGTRDAVPSESNRDPRAPEGYLIERELGRGGMGIVYLARDVKLNRRCALKVIRSGSHAGPGERERFRTEAQAVARLQHPGVVQVFEIGEYRDAVGGVIQPFMALEYCAGGSLDEVLAQNPLEPQMAAGLVRSLAEAIQAAHAANVIHRDLKPANVLLAADPLSQPASSPREGTESSPGKESAPSRGPLATFVPKITDFGLAKMLDEGGATQTGNVLGTPSYMPPEQAAGKREIGPAADIYSLGAILYACLSGRPPFRAASALETLQQVQTREAVPLRQLNPGVPRDLETIAHKCLQKEPKNRYASARELADDLGRFLAGEPVRARPIGPLERGVRWMRRNPVVAALAAAVVLVLAVGVVVSGSLAVIAFQAAEQANSRTIAAQNAERQAATNLILAEERESAEKLAKTRAEAETRRAEREKKRADANAAEAIAALEHSRDRLQRLELALYAGKLAQAQREFRDGNGARAIQLLTECPWHLREIEFRHLWTRFNAVQNYVGHTKEVRGVDYHPDGTRLASGAQDGRIRIWDVVSGRELGRIEGHTGEVRGVRFRPDGKQLASASADQTVKVWDVEQGGEIRTLKGHRDQVNAVTYSPDGTRIASGSNDGTVKIWDAATGNELFTFRSHKEAVYAVAFSPNGRQLVSGSGDDTVKIWDAITGKEIHSITAHPVEVLGVAFSPDGLRIASCGGISDARIWDAQTGKELLDLKHPEQVNAVAFSPDGARIVTGCEDRKVRVWDAKSGRELLSLRGHEGPVRTVVFSPDVRWVVSGSDDHTVRRWDLHRGQEILTKLQVHTPAAFNPAGTLVLSASPDRILRGWEPGSGRERMTLQGHRTMIYSVAFSPEGSRLASGGGGIGDGGKVLPGELRVWDLATGRQLHALEGHTAHVYAVAYSPDGKELASTGRDRTVKLWETATGKERLTLSGHRDQVYCLAFSPDGRQILSGANNAEAILWDRESGRSIRTLTGHLGAVYGVTFSPDGKRMATAGADQTVRIWDAATGRMQLELRGHLAFVTCVVFARDGRRILSGSHDGTVKIWDANKGQELLSLKAYQGHINTLQLSPEEDRILIGDDGVTVLDAGRQQSVFTLKGHDDNIECVSVRPDGKRILSGSRDRTAKLWDAETGQELLTLVGHTDGVAAVCISPDGKRLATGGADKRVKLWDANTGQELHTLAGADNPLFGVRFSDDGERIFAWEHLGAVRAWTVQDGRPVDPGVPPMQPSRDTAQSADGTLQAVARGKLTVTNLRLAAPPRPLPDTAERKRFHTEQVDLARMHGNRMGVVYHLDRLLLDDPENAELKARREEQAKRLPMLR